MINTRQTEQLRCKNSSKDLRFAFAASLCHFLVIEQTINATRKLTSNEVYLIQTKLNQATKTTYNNNSSSRATKSNASKSTNVRIMLRLKW